jgi:hypothetical protein
VLTGMNYTAGGAQVRREAGDVVDDIPASSVGWLVAGGHLEELPEEPAELEAADEAAEAVEPVEPAEAEAPAEARRRRRG